LQKKRSATPPNNSSFYPPHLLQILDQCPLRHSCKHNHTTRNVPNKNIAKRCWK
jgi:hypothetical protein